MAAMTMKEQTCSSCHGELGTCLFEEMGIVRKYYLFSDRRWLIFGGGYSSSGSDGLLGRLSRFYQKCVVPVILQAMLASFTAATVLSADDKKDVILPFHFALTLITLGMGYLIRNGGEEGYDEAVTHLRNGLFSYEDEEEDERMKEIRRIGLEELQQDLDFFAKLVIGASSMFSAVRPILLHLFIDLNTEGKKINPYVNLPLYWIFETQSVSGQVLANFLGSILTCYLAMWVLCFDETYAGATAHIKIHLELLNYSVSQIERRAYLKFVKKMATSMPWDESFYAMEEFQDCLYFCLRANARHHQAILRILKKLQIHFINAALTLLAIMASITLAVGGFAILQSLSNGGGVLTSLPYIGLISLIALETVFTFRFCRFGEIIITKSEELYEVLYSTPWIFCSRGFKVLLMIMLCNTRRPIRLKTPSINFTASYTSFGDIISLMYQLLNLERKALS